MTDFVCSRCKQKDYNAEIERQLKQALPANRELYDFGGGMVIVPIPDVGSDKASYRTAHMAALIELDDDRRCIRGLTFEVPYRLIKQNKSMIDVGDFVALVLRASAQFDGKAIPWGQTTGEILKV
jgi:hypothetical protein